LICELVRFAMIVCFFKYTNYSVDDSAMTYRADER
jgi:hypothetical protein